MRLRLLLVTAFACGHGGGPPGPPAGQHAMPVELTTLQPTKVVESSEYLATLRSRTAATLQPQVDGQVTAILVRAGDVVKPGQPLVKIDPGRQPAAVAQARASREAREAQLKLAEQNLERVQKLVATGALPEQELDNARTEVEAAKADVAALGAEITGSQVQLGYYQIVAPGHGIVGDIPVRVGDHVTPQTVVTTVTDNSVLEANISIPVERAGQLQLGMEVQLVDESSQVIGAGQLTFISPQVNADTQSVLVKANIDNASGKLRADQVVRARVVWSSHDGLVVPALAITRLGSQAFVFLAQAADGGMAAKQRPVELGELTNNTYVVTAGLKAGDRIIAAGVQKVRDGMPIAPAPPHAGSGAPPPG